MGATWQIEPDAAAVADAACRLIGMAARAAIAEHGRFRLVLAGGNTPRATYERLAKSDQSWKHWRLYYGDERCLPADDPDRNSRMVEETGLAARAGKHFPIPAELGPKAAASEYAARIRGAMPFDLVLLGVGEDGHTASLFPDLEWPDKPVFAVKNAPKPPPQRVTLGIGALQSCTTLLVLVAGAGKAEAVRRWRTGEPLPVARVSDVDHALVVADRDSLALASDQSAPATVDVE